jgi:hypothetical protein
VWSVFGLKTSKDGPSGEASSFFFRSGTGAAGTTARDGSRGGAGNCLGPEGAQAQGYRRTLSSSLWVAIGSGPIAGYTLYMGPCKRQ